MSAEVVPLLSRQRHPAGSSLTVEPRAAIIDPAGAITQVAREWDRLHRDLTAGVGALPSDQGYAVLQAMVTALVHRHARPALVLLWPQLLEAVRRLDQVMDSDLEPLDVGCLGYAEAVAKLDAELAWLLYPLVHGLPVRDACSDCVRTHASVNTWQTRLSCTDHANGRAV